MSRKASKTSNCPETSTLLKFSLSRALRDARPAAKERQAKRHLIYTKEMSNKRGPADQHSQRKGGAK